MSGVTIWNKRVFVTSHAPIQSLEEKHAVKDILGFCIDADTGKILWKVMLPGHAFISLAGGFTDGTVFAPITDGNHVWFFNRCGSMGCFDFSGKQIWLRTWQPRFKHNNRQAEPYLVKDTILYVEVASKTHGMKIQKWAAATEKAVAALCPSADLDKDYYLHHFGDPRPYPVPPGATPRPSGRTLAATAGRR